MSTRSHIARENTDGSFDSIYCHWDGYPSHNGKLLLEHFQEPAKLAQLLALGDLSSLEPEIGSKHSFDTRVEGQCTAYGRDRGEKGTESKHYKTAASFARMLKQAWTEWVYIYRVTDGKWYFTNNPSPTWFKCCGTEQRATQELTMEACKEK